MVAYALSFVDRLILSLLVEPIRHDLHLTDIQISLLQGFSFAIFYTLAGIPVGRLVDAGRRTVIIAIGITLWSLMTATCGMVQHYWQLFIARAGVGVGEATLGPAAYSLLGDLFAPAERGLALGIFSAGTSIGAGLALIIGGQAIDLISAGGARSLPWLGTLQPWQLTFLYVGLPGVLVAGLVLLIPEPVRRDDTPAPTGGSGTTVSLPETIGHFRRHAVTIVLHHLAMGLSGMAGYGILAWAPTMLMRVHGWGPAEAGTLIGACILAAGTLGVIAGGALGDLLLRRGQTTGRLDAAALAMALGAAGAVSYPFQQSLPALAACFTIAMLGAFMVIGCASAVVLDITPNRLRGLATAVFFFVTSVLGVGLGPTMVALVTDYVFGHPQAVREALTIVPTLGFLLAGTCFIAARNPYRRSRLVAARA
ncbi:MAG: MFS transporter [Gammaproteobacteria bacterium]|nr:MFS transporter [Gammaproteobacteria bacterium]